MTRVKICGITRAEDALFAQDSGADALGFVFYSKSKRFVSVENAMQIIRQLNPFIAKVGVFVNENIDTINDIAQKCGLTHVQLHGDETPEEVIAVQRPVIKALNFSDTLLRHIEQWQSYDILIDSGTKEMPGGTGKTIPWQVLQELHIKRPFTLAGGLTPDNIEEGLETLHPAAVDVSSGVEMMAGIKDHNLIKQFIDHVKRYTKK